MGNVARAMQSPRILAGELQFYEGDTFALDLHFDLRDLDDMPVELIDGDEVFFRIFDRYGRRIYEERLEFGDEMTIRFDAALVADMPQGRYYATVQIVHAGEVGTMAKNVPILVR